MFYDEAIDKRSKGESAYSVFSQLGVLLCGLLAGECCSIDIVVPLIATRVAKLFSGIEKRLVGFALILAYTCRFVVQTNVWGADWAMGVSWYFTAYLRLLVIQLRR